MNRTPCDEGVIRGGPPAASHCVERDKPWVLAATILGSSLAFIDGSVVNVALPAIQSDLGASVQTTQWIVNAYMLMQGSLILVGGAAGDRFGRRRVFVWGLVLFTISSVACGLAPNAATLIAARAAQGIGGAFLVPTSLAIISTTFPPDERGRAIGVWAGFSALTTALGPVLGGWLVDSASWRAIFYVNVPIAAIAWMLALWRITEARDAGAARTGVDWPGGLLATAGLGAIAYGLTAVSDRGWTDPVVVGALLAGAIVLAVFIQVERRAAAPMLPLDLFRSRNFTGANVITVLLYFGLSAAMFFLPFNLIRIQDYSATQAGASYLPFTLIMAVLSRWSGGLVDRYGARLPLTVGPIVTATGFALLAVPGIGGTYWTTFFPAMVVFGVGMAISVAPLTTTVMNAAGAGHAGVASGVNNAAARVAGLLAVALLGAIAVGIFGASLGARLDDLRVSPDVRRALEREIPKLAEAEVPPGAEGDARQALTRALDESFVWSYRATMLIAASLALLSGLCAAAMIRPLQPDTEHADARKDPSHEPRHARA